MRRGEIWTVASGSGYGGKPRPAIIVQSDAFTDMLSLTVCGLTTDDTDAPIFRLPIAPTDSNGLLFSSRIMVDKIVTIPKTKVRERIGVLDSVDLSRLDQALIVFLGLATSPKSQRAATRTTIPPRGA